MKNYCYTIYNSDGINLEEQVPVESFTTIGKKMCECLESEYTLAISPTGTAHPTLQVVPVTDQEGNQAIMLSFENDGKEFCRFYEQPYTDEKLQEILQYLHAFCIQDLLPDTNEAGWISTSDENTGYLPEAAAFYVDAMNRPYCKSVEGILYLMFDGTSPDDYSVMSLEDMDWDVNGLQEVDAETAGKAARLHVLIENAFFTFWTAGDGSSYAVNHLDMIFRVTQEPNGQLTLSAPPDLQWQKDWQQVSLEQIKREK